MLIKISDPKGEKSFFVRKMFAFSAVKKLNEAGMIKLSFPDDLAGLEEFEIKKGFLIQAFLSDENKKVHCIFSGYIEERSIVGNVVNLVGYDFIGYAKHRMIREDLKFQNTAIKNIIETIFWKLNAVSVLPFSLGKNNGEELISIEFKAFTSLYTILKELSKKVSDLQIRHRSEIVGNGSKEYLDISKNCGVQHSWIWSDNANIQQRNSKIVSREWKDNLWNTCNYWRDNNGNIRENQSSISQWLLFEKFEQNPEKTPDELIESAGLVTIVPEVSREEMTQLTVGDQKAIRLIARLEWARFEYLGIIQEVSFGSNSAGGLDFSIKIWEKLIEQKNILDKTLANLASAVKKSWPSNAPAPQVDLSWYATSSAVNQAIQSQNTKIEKKADSSFVQWVAQTAQTALNAANQAKQTADSKANDSDVVHKSWNETIDWWKTFSGWLALRDNKIYLRSHWDNNHYIKFDPWAWNWWDWVRIHEIGGFTFSTIDGDVFKLTAQGNLKFGKTEADIEVKDLTLWKHNPKETQTISQYAKATNWTPWGINFIDYVAATPNWLTNWGKELRWYLRIGDATRTFDRFQVRGYEWFDGTEASLPNAKKYIKLEAPKILLWDDDILWDWKTYTPTVSANWSPTITESFWKYQKIWKTVHCKVKLRVRRNWSYWRFFVSLPVNARDTWEIVDGTSIVWTFWASNSNNYGYITVSNWHAQILWGIWHAGNFGNLSEDVFISFSITYEAI